MKKHVWLSVTILILFALLTYFLIREQRPGAKYPFRFGLDLVGGTELIYKADTSKVSDVGGAMDSLKDVIERRVNIFGVSEPLIQVENAGIISGNKEERLLVELPGVTDIDKAIALIGETPSLEFRLAKPGADQIIKNNPKATLDDLFIPTGITGRSVASAQVNFDPNTRVPVVGLTFNNEGKDLLQK